MYCKVKAYIEKYQMFRQNDVVLAGVSGGGDSMAMLHMLVALRKEYELDVRVVHVHHGIRGEEAERDSDLVKEVCSKWNLPCSIYRYCVPELALKWKLGEEETGRIVRRQAYEKECETIGVRGDRVKIALAHNMDDQAETVLHNLARGTGLRGGAGIRPVSEKIVRPVLCLERKEIEKYLEENAIPYITDSTNLEDSYTRNRIRHHILPAMRNSVNEQAVAHISEAAQKFAAADAYFTAEGKKLSETYSVGSEEYHLTEMFEQHPEIIQQYIIMEILEKLAGRRKDISMLHVDQVLRMFGMQTGKYCRLPYQIVVWKGYSGVIIKKGEYQCDTSEYMIREAYEAPVLVTETGIHFPEEFDVEILSANGQKICEKKYTKWLDYDKIQSGLTVRNRKTGDYIVIDQNERRKKISRYMIDEKIPREIRDSVCMLADGAEIVWIIGKRINERYKITEKTTKILKVLYKGGKENE